MVVALKYACLIKFIHLIFLEASPIFNYSYVRFILIIIRKILLYKHGHLK